MNMESSACRRRWRWRRRIRPRLDLGRETLVPIDRPVAGGHRSQRIRYRVASGGLRSVRGVRLGPVAAGQADRRPHGRGDRVRHSAGPEGRQSAAAARIRRPTPTGSRTISSRATTPGSWPTPARRPAAKPIRGGWPWPWSVTCTKRCKHEGFHAGVRHGGRGGPDPRRRLHRARRVSGGDGPARGIPARVAVGLVYMPQSRTFGYHMWTEVYIERPMDPVDGDAGQGRDRRRPFEAGPEQSGGGWPRIAVSCRSSR